MSHVDTEADELAYALERVGAPSAPVLVYIAGPYTRPDPCINTYKAVEVASELVDLGFVPFVPHLTHFWHTMRPKPYDFWLAYDMAWLAKCDAVLRMPGESPGADKEVIRAGELNIPVFETFAALVDWRDWTR